MGYLYEIKIRRREFAGCVSSSSRFGFPETLFSNRQSRRAYTVEERRWIFGLEERNANFELREIAGGGEREISSSRF